jgi:hypothetical protein
MKITEMNEEILIDYFFNLLLENEQEDRLIDKNTKEPTYYPRDYKNLLDASGALGSGSISIKKKKMKSLAHDNPRKLLEKLRITDRANVEDSELKQILYILKQTSRCDVMAAAYSFSKNTQDNKVTVQFDESLKGRDATMFIQLTLIAALNYGLINLKRGVKFSRKDHENVIFIKGK